MNTRIIPEEIVKAAYQKALTKVRAVIPADMRDLSEPEKQMIKIGCWAGVTEMIDQAKAWFDKNTSSHSE